MEKFATVFQHEQKRKMRESINAEWEREISGASSDFLKHEAEKTMAAYNAHKKIWGPIIDEMVQIMWSGRDKSPANRPDELAMKEAATSRNDHDFNKE